MERQVKVNWTKWNFQRFVERVKCRFGFHHFSEEKEYLHDNPKFRFYICLNCGVGQSRRVKL